MFSIFRVFGGYFRVSLEYFYIGYRVGFRGYIRILVLKKLLGEDFLFRDWGRWSV